MEPGSGFSHSNVPPHNFPSRRNLASLVTNEGYKAVRKLVYDGRGEKASKAALFVSSGNYISGVRTCLFKWIPKAVTTGS
ncbi:hypothetical protein TWF128_007853 [Orbilia oligospora]|nr:hypothetical protein TWF128_007853 [Orbilia oligospora]